MKGMLLKIKSKAISIGAGVLLTFIVILGFFSGIMRTVTGDAANSSYSGNYFDYVNLGDYIVKTDEEGAMPALTKNQLKAAIDKCYSGQMHDNCISVLDDLISVQNKYKINAIFMLAVAQKESTCGTGWDAIDPNSHNWFSILYGAAWNGDSGKTCTGGVGTWCWYDSFSEAVQKYGIYMTQHDYFYFGHGEYTVSQIAPHFAGKEWMEGVEEYIDTLYAAVAETLPSVSTGRYENGQYTFGNKTYTVYNQHNYNDYFGNNSNGSRTISSAGCGATSIATCLSGFGKTETPSTITKHCISKGYNYTCDDNYAITKWLGEYGFKGERVDGFDQEKVFNHLKSGKPVILNYAGQLVLTSGSSYYTNGHFTALLGIEGNEIFNGDPGGLSGYVTKSNLLKVELRGYYLVDKK